MGVFFPLCIVAEKSRLYGFTRTTYYRDRGSTRLPTRQVEREPILYIR